MSKISDYLRSEMHLMAEADRLSLKRSLPTAETLRSLYAAAIQDITDLEFRLSHDYTGALSSVQVWCAPDGDRVQINTVSENGIMGGVGVLTLDAAKKRGKEIGRICRRSTHGQEVLGEKIVVRPQLPLE